MRRADLKERIRIQGRQENGEWIPESEIGHVWDATRGANSGKSCPRVGGKPCTRSTRPRPVKGAPSQEASLATTCPPSWGKPEEASRITQLPTFYVCFSKDKQAAKENLSQKGSAARLVEASFGYDLPAFLGQASRSVAVRSKIILCRQVLTPQLPESPQA